MMSQIRLHWTDCFTTLALMVVCIAQVTADDSVVPQSKSTESELANDDPLELLVRTLSETHDSAIRVSLLRGMLSGLEGRRDVTSPTGWSELARRFSTQDNRELGELSAQLSMHFGDVAANQLALSVLRDGEQTAASRRTALHSLLNQQNLEASQYLESLLDDPRFTRDAIRGYSSVENPKAPQELLKRYKTLSPDLRRCVLETLASRKSYAEQLLKAIEQQVVPCEAIPTHVARTLHRILGTRFARLYGELKPVAKNREKLIAKYKAMITPMSLANANVSHGRAVFNKTCAACHQMYGEGGTLGPDLTGSNRANLDYILLNSVDPSYDVPAGYRMVTLLTVDGRVVTGVVAEEDQNRVVLKTVEQARLVIAKQEIEERVIAETSMMPDGQLDAMKPQEVIDLIKYLRTTKQVEVTK